MLQNTCGNKQGQMMTPVLPPPSSKSPFSTSTKPLHIENEWEMTFGPVYLQLVRLNFLM